jgi:hypothetical protein
MRTAEALANFRRELDFQNRSWAVELTARHVSMRTEALQRSENLLQTLEKSLHDMDLRMADYYRAIRVN